MTRLTMTRDVYSSLLSVFIVSITLGNIEGHPYKSHVHYQRSMEYELPSSETTTSNYDEPQHSAAFHSRDSLSVAHESRTEAPVSRTRGALGSDDKIVFPSDLPDNWPTQVAPVPPVAKCSNTTFCEYPTFYPEDFIKQAIKTRNDLRFLSTVDPGPEIGQRIDGIGGDESLCSYEETVVFPKTGQNKDKEWLYIVNEENFSQGVRIETCMTENTACRIIEGFADGYTTSCKQKYVYRQLAAVGSNGSLGADLFRFPSSCCCHVKFSGNPLVRLGVGADKATKQSPAHRTGETSRETGKK